MLTTMGLAAVLTCVLSTRDGDANSGVTDAENVLNASSGLVNISATASRANRAADAMHGEENPPIAPVAALGVAALVVLLGGALSLTLVRATPGGRLKVIRFGVLADTCGMVARPMRTVALAYCASIVVQVILAGLVHVIESDSWAEQQEGNAGFDKSLVFVLTTFVGGSYGDTFPVTTAGRTVIALVSACGYVLQLFHIVLVVQTTLNLAAQGDVGNSPSALAKFRLLMPIYLVVVCIALLLGVLTHAIGGIDDDQACPGTEEENCEADLFDALYLLWMTAHGTTFGEIIPANAGARTITWLAMVMNYFLTIGFAALTAIPNRQNYNFIHIPLLQQLQPPPEAGAGAIDARPVGGAGDD